MQNSPARTSIDVGSVIADTYTIEALIGRGGMGAVFMASHKRLPGKKVAIKVLHAEMSGEEVLARFKREAEIASRLGHPNIVAVHDFNLMADGTPYLVLEYLHGESLAQRLGRGPLAIEHAFSIVRQVGSALAAAHREGIVHRDLKPQNIFLVPTEVDGRVVEIAKVLDFGISKIRGSQTVKTQDSALLGTPQYMAPEQATGQHKHVDERTDVFAFGAIVYEMLSGAPAFSGETIPEVVFKVVYEQPPALGERVGGLPPAVIAAVHRAMAKNQAERFANVGELVEALTGQPLAPSRAGISIPPPDVGFATGSRAPNTGGDAFAQTMGSGDHGQAVAPAPSGSQVPGSQAPIASQANVGTDRTVSAGPGAAQVPSFGTDRTVSAGPGSAQVPSVAQVPGAHVPSVAQLPAAPPRKNTGAIIASVLGAAAIAAVVVYFVMRPPPAPPPVAQTEPVASAAIVDAAAAVSEAPAPGDAAVVETKPDETIAKPDDKPTTPDDRPAKPDKPRPPDPKPAKPDPKADKPPPPDDDPDDDGGDELIAKKLHDAQQALAASDWDRAESLANAVTTSEDAVPRQKARASLIYGTVQCLARNNAGRAAAALRSLTGAPKLRRKLLETCQRAGYLRNVR